MSFFPSFSFFNAVSSFNLVKQDGGVRILCNYRQYGGYSQTHPKKSDRYPLIPITEREKTNLIKKKNAKEHTEEARSKKRKRMKNEFVPKNASRCRYILITIKKKKKKIIYRLYTNLGSKQMPMLTIERERKRDSVKKNKKETKIDKTYRPPFLQLPEIFEKEDPVFNTLSLWVSRMTSLNEQC